MTSVCIIPAKPYTRSKTRLSTCLPDSERAALSHQLLLRTVRLAWIVTGQVIVVSQDANVLQEAQAEGAFPLLETTPGLNPALAQATRVAVAQGTDGVLVLPADLPWLTAEDIQTILAEGDSPHCVVVAPSRDETGTNALLLRPPGVIPFAFGPDSFHAHCAAARGAGIEPIVYRSPTIALDLDTPADWQAVLEE
jgi:2-phospho-L-lactate guanylyltransferase